MRSNLLKLENAVMSGDSRTNETLVAEYATGDRSALEELVKRHWPEAFRISLRVLGDPAAAEDAAQEVFVAIIRGARKFERGRPFGPWFGAIVMNSARQHSRSERTRKQYEERAAKARPPETAAPAGEERVLASELEACFERLPFELRAPLVLHFFEGRTYEEVAAVTGCQKSTAHARIGRGLEQLRAALAGASCAVALPALESAPQASGAKETPTPHAPSIASLEAAARKATLAALTTKAVALLALVGAVALGASALRPASPPGADPALAPPASSSALAAAGSESVSSTQEESAAPSRVADAPVASTSLVENATALGHPGDASNKTRSALLDVRVRDARGQAVAKAQVVFVDARKAERDDEAPDVDSWSSDHETDEQGHVEIASESKFEERLENGELVLSSREVPLGTGRRLWVFARRGLEQGLAGPFELREAKGVSVTIDLRRAGEPRRGRGTLLATVTKGGLPLRGAAVTGEWEAPDGNGSRSVPVGQIREKTDDEGRFAVADLRPARYRFCVKAEETATVTFEEKIPADATVRHDVALVAGAACEGRLVLAPGLELKDVNSLNGCRQGAGGLVSVSGVVLPTGRYRFANLEPGDYDVDVLLERGFANARATFRVPESGLVEGPEIKVGFGARVTGRALDRRGAPLESFESVWITGSELNVSTKLEAEGRFVVQGVAAGSYDLKLRLQKKDELGMGSFDWEANARLVVADGSATVDLGDVRFPVDENPWQLAGRVVDGDSKPVAGAEVELVRPGGWPLTTTETDADGRFTIAEEKPGTVVVAARHFEEVSAPLSFETKSGETKSAELKLTERTGGIAGRFVPPLGVPLSAVAHYKAYCERSCPTGGDYPFTHQSVALDAEGRFRFEKLPPGEYATRIISVTASEKATVAPGAEASVVLDLSEATEKVNVSVDGELSEKWSHVELSFEGRPGKVGGRMIHGLTNGKAEFGHVAPGRFKVEVESLDPHTRTVLFVRGEGDVAPGSPAALAFKWPKKETTGRVRGSVKGHAEGARVWALGGAVTAFRYLENDGSFTLAGLPEGDYRLVVSEEEPAVSVAGETVHVTAGGEVEVDLGE